MSQLSKALFLPFFGEFGHYILTHIKLVHQYKCDYKIVCCKKGHECYFPSASEFYYFEWNGPNGRGWRAPPDTAQITARCIAAFPDIHTVCTGATPTPFDVFQIKPLKVRGLKFDVVISPRNVMSRKICNWNRWQELVDLLASKGLTVGAVGSGKSSFILKNCQNSWDFGDEDSAVEMLQNCQVYVGVDSGCTHLAAFLQAAMLVLPLNVKWMRLISAVNKNAKFITLSEFDPTLDPMDNLYSKIAVFIE